MNEIILDVIPIYKNEMYPTKEGIWHFHNKSYGNGEFMKEKMMDEIRHKFSDCNAIIILEKGKVIEIF